MHIEEIGEFCVDENIQHLVFVMAAKWFEGYVSND